MRSGVMCAALLGLLVLTASAAHGQEEDPILAFVKARLKDPKKPFTLIVGVKVKEGAGDKFETAFAKALKETRKEKGCLTYDLNRDSSDATKYLVYERWKSLADLEAHLKSDHIKALRTVLPDVLDGAPELQVLLPVSE